MMQSRAAIWILFNLVILTILGAELFAMRRRQKVPSLSQAALMSGLSVVVALFFFLYIFWVLGWPAAEAFLAGYVMEKGLSVDNLFVFLVIFQAFATPQGAIFKVLFWGIWGAILLRTLFIFVGLALLQLFHFMIYLFALFLIAMGIYTLMSDPTPTYKRETLLMRLAARFFPFTSDYVGDQFFVRREGRLWATPLFATLLAVEMSDLLFALDSIPVVFAITRDPLIVYTSNIAAVLGLRALYFLLHGLVRRMRAFHYGLGLLLLFIGVKMILDAFFEIPVFITLLGAVFILGLTALYSFFQKK